MNHSLGLFIWEVFLLISFCCQVNILLYFINKILVIFKHSVIYCVHFRPVGMKAFMDQTYILSPKDIYFQKPVSETITPCKFLSFSYFKCSLSRKINALCYTRSSLSVSKQIKVSAIYQRTQLPHKKWKTENHHPFKVDCCLHSQMKRKISIAVIFEYISQGLK